jgi:hypothetical protein
VAVIWAVPAAMPFTTPVADTEATLVLLELQLMARPVRVFPFESFVTADIWTVPPTCTFTGDGETATVETATGGAAVTVRSEALLLPSLEAEIVALPAATPVTNPVASTVATEAFELAQTTVRPESGFPVESLRVATACAVCPTCTVDGLTETDRVAIGVGVGGAMASVAWPEMPSLTALSTAAPGATADIMPESLTLAIAGLEVYQRTARFLSGSPFASFGIAVALAVWPATREAGAETLTDATFAGVLSTTTADVP